MAYFPQTLSDLQSMISNGVNDPSNTRYPLTLINQQLDLAQMRWNREAKICRKTDTITVIAGIFSYALATSLTLPLMKVLRVTHKGIDLKKRSKDYYDLFASYDWTADNGTPSDFYIDLNATPQTLNVRPNPTSNDAGAYLKVEYVTPHQPMANSTDTPFIVNGVSNALILPYIGGLGYEAMATILEPDPTPETAAKAKIFRKQAEDALSNVIQIYYDLEAEEPIKMQGGRNWQF